MVDGDDFLIWQAGFGLPVGATAADGDADGDGDVDPDDLGIWRATAGLDLGAGSIALAERSAALRVAGIPEPGTLLLALPVALLGLATARSREKSAR